MSDYRLSLAPRTAQDAQDAAKTILEQSEAEMGMVPNMYARMANSPGLLQTYTEGYNRFREESGFSAAEQEVVLLTISRHNGCTYCMAAHSMIADNMSGVPEADLQALRDGKPLVDGQLRALADFCQHLLETQGHPQSQAVEQFLAAGYTERQILEIVLAMAVKLLSNYSNHLFQTPVDDAFAAYTWPADADDDRAQTG